MTTRISFGASLPVLAAALLGQLPGTVLAQGSSVRVGAGVVAEGFKFDKPGAVGMEAISLVTAPFGARFTGPVILELAGAYAVGVLVRTDGEVTDISGPTDSSIRLAIPLANQRFTISAAAYLPTGKSTQTLEEATIAGVIAADLLPFRITNWGSGGGFDLSASVALPVGSWGVGARVGYSAAREFKPLEGGTNVFSYQPGDQKYVRLALDRSFGESSKASVSATMQRFSDDAFDGQNLYRSGDRLEILASLDLAAGPSATAALYAGVMHRSESAFLDGSQDFAAQDLMVAGAGLRLPMGRAAFMPSADVRVFRRADGEGQGYVFGLGSAFELGAFVPTIRGRLGNLIINDQTSTRFFGGEVGLALRVGR